jgi:hypothetical protein
MTGILETIRKLVGAGDSPGPFDTDLLIHINSALSVLTQLGAGPVEGFIATENSEWTEFLSASRKLEMVKTYVYLKVKLIFDPPPSSSAVESMKLEADKYEWRIQVEVDPPVVIPVETSEGVI